MNVMRLFLGAGIVLGAAPALYAECDYSAALDRAKARAEAFQNHDYEGIYSFMLPGIIEEARKQHSNSTKTFFLNSFETNLGQVNYQSIDIDETMEQIDGTPCQVRLQTRSVVEASGKTYQIDEPWIGFYEEGDWKFSNIGEEVSNDYVKLVYPDIDLDNVPAAKAQLLNP